MTHSRLVEGQGWEGRKEGRKERRDGGREGSLWFLVHAPHCTVFSCKRFNDEIADFFPVNIKPKTKNISELLFFRRKKNVSPAL